MATKKQATTNGVSATDKALNLFADMMIKKIETIQQDWKKPWFCNGALMWPRNLNGRYYNGMNSFMLLMHCEEQGYKHPIFCTFDRVMGLNYEKDKQGKMQPVKGKDGKELPAVCVKKGEKSFPVMLAVFQALHVETNEKLRYDKYQALSEEDKKQYRIYPSMQVYHVFNIDQTNMEEVRPEMYQKQIRGVEPPKRDASKMFCFEPMDRMIAEDLWVCPIKPKYGDDAYYSISKDEIVIPEKTQFSDGESFYGNLFHEMAHSTGAEKRLNRIKPTKFGCSEYAKEELVAELTAALVGQMYGITKHVKDDSVAYLKGWLETLKEDPKFIKTVLFDVKKASAMLNQRIEEVKNGVKSKAA